MPNNKQLNIFLLNELNKLASKTNNSFPPELDAKAATDHLRLELQTIREVEEFKSLGQFADLFFENLKKFDQKDMTNPEFQKIFNFTLSLIDRRFLNDFSKDQLISTFNSIAMLVIQQPLVDAHIQEKINLLLNFISLETRYKLIDFSQRDLEILMSCSWELIKKEKINDRYEVAEKIYLILKHYININPNGEFLKGNIRGFFDGLDNCINNLKVLDNDFFDKIIVYFKKCFRKDPSSFKSLLIERNFIDNLLCKINANLELGINKDLLVKSDNESLKKVLNWPNVKDILLIVNQFLEYDYHYLSKDSVKLVELFLIKLKEKSNVMKASVIDQLFEILSKKGFIKKFGYSESLHDLRPAQLLVNDMMVKLSTSHNSFDSQILARVILKYSFWVKDRGACLDECNVKTLNALFKLFCGAYQKEQTRGVLTNQNAVAPISNVMRGLSALIMFNNYQPENDFSRELERLFPLLLSDINKFSMGGLTGIFCSLRILLSTKKMEFQPKDIELLLKRLLESNQLLDTRYAFLNAFETVSYYILNKKNYFLNGAQELINRFLDEYNFQEAVDKQYILRIVSALKNFATVRTLRFREQDIDRIKSIFLSYEVGRNCSTNDLTAYADSLATFVERKILSFDEKLSNKVQACVEVNQNQQLSNVLKRFNAYKNGLPIIKKEEIVDNTATLWMQLQKAQKPLSSSLNQKRNIQDLQKQDNQEEIYLGEGVKEQCIRSKNKGRQDSFAKFLNQFFPPKLTEESDPLVIKAPINKKLKFQNSSNSSDSYNKKKSNIVEFDNSSNNENGFDDGESKFSI